MLKLILMLSWVALASLNNAAMPSSDAYASGFEGTCNLLQGLLNLLRHHYHC
jgi:hypothetical protein